MHQYSSLHLAAPHSTFYHGIMAKPHRQTHTTDSHLVPFAKHQLRAHSHVQVSERFCAHEHEDKWRTRLCAAAASLDHVRLPCGVEHLDLQLAELSCTWSDLRSSCTSGKNKTWPGCALSRRRRTAKVRSVTCWSVLSSACCRLAYKPEPFTWQLVERQSCHTSQR